MRKDSQLPIFGKRKQHDETDPLASIRHRLSSNRQQTESTKAPTDLVAQMSKDDLLLHSSHHRRVTPVIKEEGLPRRVDHRQV
jgi:hypothetical protein